MTMYDEFCMGAEVEYRRELAGRLRRAETVQPRPSRLPDQAAPGVGRLADALARSWAAARRPRPPFTPAGHTPR